MPEHIYKYSVFKKDGEYILDFVKIKIDGIKTDGDLGVCYYITNEYGREIPVVYKIHLDINAPIGDGYMYFSKPQDKVEVAKKIVKVIESNYNSFLARSEEKIEQFKDKISACYFVINKEKSHKNKVEY